ncbi:hypothetical protein PAHAL_5G492400 [Panicum hallii]|uniref:Uncharacterized protein n=1 Tax=Panicum hallii TaxID=206008 RepID=A0A2T8IP07_9POAL|nr:hypothetical protein PAHAL_5G492400 [Panicum hallii]
MPRRTAAEAPPPPLSCPLLTQHASRWRCECALAGGESVADVLLVLRSLSCRPPHASPSAASRGLAR